MSSKLLDPGANPGGAGRGLLGPETSTPPPPKHTLLRLPKLPPPPPPEKKEREKNVACTFLVINSYLNLPFPKSCIRP